MISQWDLCYTWIKPPSYVSPGKYTIDLKGSKTVPIKGVDDKRQITATFTVTASGSFLPIQLTYSGKTKHSLPKFDFPKCFDVTFTPNHWSNYVLAYSRR